MKECRPKFDEITSFDEFKKYYWYRDELSQICKSLGLEYRGIKQELKERNRKRKEIQEDR